MSLEEPCRVPVDRRWTPQEQFVWKRACVGEAADFNTEPAREYGGKLDPKEPDKWPQTRVLRSKFLEMLLLKEPYRSKLTRLGIVIDGARFTEVIDLRRAELQRPLVLLSSLIEKGVDFSRLKSKYPLDLSGSNVLGTLNASDLDLDSGLSMSDHAEFADVDLSAAHVGGQFDLSGSKVTGKLNMNGLRVDGSLLMRDKAEFADVDLIGAHVGGQLALEGSKVTGKLDMNGLHVDEGLFSNEAEFAEVGLGGARVGGQLDLNGSKVTGKLNMNGLRVDGSLLMRDKAEFVDVDLTGAHVGGQLVLRGSKVAGKLNMNGLRVDEALLMRDKAEFVDVDLTAAHVGRTFDLRGSKISGELICYGIEVGQRVFLSEGAKFGGPIDLRVANIKGDLDLRGGVFSQTVDFTGAAVGGSPFFTSAEWSPDMNLILDGLTYQSVADADQFAQWFGKLPRYARQPYDQLASVVQRQGDSALATEIRYSGRERERSEANGMRWAGLTILKWVVGYGYHPEWSVPWALGLVVLGAVALRISGEGPRNGMPFGLTYSFDMLLPVIRLREKHYQIDLQSWVRYYFYGQKIMGYVLAFFLIATVSGIAK